MQETIYEERIYSRWNILITGIVVLALLAMLVWQTTAGPLGTRPASNWFFAGMSLFFLFIGINFARLTIRVTTQGISAGYGIIRHYIPWSNVEGYRMDETSTLTYGGWGIRMAWADGKRRLVYNIIGGPRVVIEKRQGSFPEFVFSTRNPEAVIKAIREGLGSRG